jgi:hypothetical protein
MKTTLARHRFSREETEGGGGGSTEGGQNDAGKQGKEYVPPTSQEEMDRIIEARLQRERARYADYDSYKAKAQQWDQLEQESQTDAEKREALIREEALQEALSLTVPNVVKMAFRVEAKGVLNDEQVESLLEDLDLLKYANDGGEPIQEKIAKKVKAFAPGNGGQGSNGNGRGPGFGQGNGHQTSTKRSGEDGMAEAKRRFPGQFAQTS